ncbi:MAG: hypothetical protein SPC84_08040, partial [Oscillospiraceae bacterium]|nr:hypothetical protein [Oscillospiraceae bacterium]
SYSFISAQKQSCTILNTHVFKINYNRLPILHKKRSCTILNTYVLKINYTRLQVGLRRFSQIM